MPLKKDVSRASSHPLITLLHPALSRSRSSLACCLCPWLAHTWRCVAPASQSSVPAPTHRLVQYQLSNQDPPTSSTSAAAANLLLRDAAGDAEQDRSSTSAGEQPIMLGSQVSPARAQRAPSCCSSRRGPHHNHQWQLTTAGVPQPHTLLLACSCAGTLLTIIAGCVAVCSCLMAASRAAPCHTHAGSCPNRR